ncbi:hypothetical protein P43SY_003072 [Pythium insidiosum]|uniref:Mitotic spindle assembly checkpoint protein MAD1 n=1 Tax=Pythium insidiosum TaxID=114742 RepID=A0AAD5LP75_PYTIN|nr:hypothetical protein P43SY_003072 [Pythium insidiosum]
MENDGKQEEEGFFLCSPIPRDPTQLLFVGDSSSGPSATRMDSSFDPDVADMTGLQMDAVLQTPETQVAMAASDRQVVALDSSRALKRPRVDGESAVALKCDHLSTEVEALRLQLANKTERHQIELKERDQQVDQLRRQLQYAIREEEHTRQELRNATSEFSTEKLQLNKKIVELDSKLQFVEASLSEWKDKALDAESELRTVTRKSKLQIQLLTDELNAEKAASSSARNTDESLLQSKVRLLEAQLRDQELDVTQANSRLENAQLTLENAQDVRQLKERITELETQERRLKTEMVSLIETSKRSSMSDEKVNLLRQKLHASEQLYAQAQRDILSLATSALNRMKSSNEELVALLQSYEKTPEGAASTAPAIESPHLSTLSDLMTKVTPALEEITKLTTEMRSPNTGAQVYETEINRLKKEYAALENEHAKLAKHLKSVEQDCAKMEKRLGRGEFNPATTKVVHLSVNPTSELLDTKQVSSECEQLRKENEQLRSALKASEAKSTPAGAVTPSTSTSTSTSTAKLTTTTSYETVEGQKLLNQRLKEVFREQTQQYREAVFQLTGFKIDLKKSSGVEILRLRSMYADHDDDELLVRMEPNGALELLETDFCSQINQRVFAYLTTCRSFPAFLATLTLHLFEKQTFQG